MVVLGCVTSAGFGWIKEPSSDSSNGVCSTVFPHFHENGWEEFWGERQGEKLTLAGTSSFL